MGIKDKLFEKLGYIKASRMAEIFGSRSLFNSFGEPQRFNYDKYLKAYADELWVYACVYTIANLIAELPYRFYEITRDNSGKTVKKYLDIPDARKLFEKPNTNDENSTWYNLIENTVASCELTGNGYLLHDETEGNRPEGKPKSLQYLIPSRVSILPGNRKSTSDTNVKFIEKYLYMPPGVATAVPLAPEEVSHFKYSDPSNYYYGLAPLAPARWSIETLKEAVKTNLNIFKNGARLDGVYETEQQLGKDVFERTKKELNQGYKGTDKAHQSPLLSHGLKYRNIVGSMKDLEFILGMKMSREDVCAAYGVSPLLVQILDKATYSNYKESLIMTYKLTIIPKLHKFNPVITSIVKLFNPDAYFEFDISQIEALKEDEKLKSETAQRYFAMGIPLNMINARLNLGFEKIPGGDIGYLPINLIPAGSIPPEREEEGERSLKKTISAERKTFLWKQFDRLTTRIMKSYMNIIDVFFSKQEAAMLARLGKGKESGITASGTPSGEYKIYSTKAKIDIEAVLFNEKGEVTKWAAESKKIHTVSVEENGKRELLNVGSTVSFDVTNPRVAEFIRTFGLKNATLIMDSLKKEIANSLAIGVEAGEGIPELKKRIQHSYAGFKDEGWKATRIARTEVIPASNQGALEAYKQSGLRLKKGWLSSHLPDARDEHLLMENRKPIPVDRDFVLPSGATCATPGQTGDAAEDCNCACSVYAEPVE